MRRGQADRRRSGQADGRTGRLKAEELRTGGLGGRMDRESGGRADGRTSRWAWV